MCVYSTKQLEKKVAETDIDVFKLLLCRFGKLYSPYMLYNRFRRSLKITLSLEEITWELGEMKSVSLGEVKTKCTSQGIIFMTSSGLYSVSSPNSIGHGGCKMFKAIIPEGSEYYEGVNGEYCSNQLKIVEEIIE